MSEQLSRTELLIGEEAVDKLAKCRVAIFGVGGVGGYVCEALVRSGIGAFDLIDNDTVALSNLNRQIIATHDTVGRYKVDVMKERMLSINPDADVRTYRTFFLPETADAFPFEEYDYVVDAIDTVTGKIEIIMRAKAAGVPVISAMGAGNKLDPTRFRVMDLFDTDTDPLAKVMRRELKKRGVRSLTVVFSDEKPLTPRVPEEAEVKTAEDAAQAEDAGTAAEAAGIEADAKNAAAAGAQEPDTSGKPAPRRRATPGSMSFVPGAAGLAIAGHVIRELAGI